MKAIDHFDNYFGALRNDIDSRDCIIYVCTHALTLYYMSKHYNDGKKNDVEICLPQVVEVEQYLMSGNI